jgi:hypothetical protein
MPTVRVRCGSVVQMRLAAGRPPVTLRMLCGAILPDNAVTMELDEDGLNVVLSRRDGAFRCAVPFVPV